MPGGPGLLSDLLHQLDVPSDVRLVSVSTSIDPVDGATVWTVQYKQTLPGQQQYPAAAPSRPKVIAPSHSMPQSPRAGPTAPLSPSHMPRDLNIEIPPSMSIQSLGGGSVMRVPPSPTPATAMRCFPLKCIVQTYAWGKIGLDSAVARLAAEGINDDIPIEEYTPYAELWMGTHPVGPSLVVLENPWKSITPLSDWLKLNPVMAGSQVRASRRRTVPAARRAARHAHACGRSARVCRACCGPHTVPCAGLARTHPGAVPV